MTESLEEATARYNAAAHAMQTAVAVKMQHDGKETEPKHLRVGVNSALSNAGGLVTLLIDKGVITREEYYTAMADAMEREAVQYHDELILKGYINPNVDLG
jgi:hypothetical protein